MKNAYKQSVLMFPFFLTGVEKLEEDD